MNSCVYDKNHSQAVEYGDVFSLHMHVTVDVVLGYKKYIVYLVPRTIPDTEYT